jgi:hypothetical protein
MITILASKSILSLDYFFAQKLGIDYLDFYLNKNTSEPLWQVWNISNWSDLSSYIGSGGNGGIFEIEAKNDKEIIIVKNLNSLVLDENAVKFLAESSLKATNDIFVYVDSGDLNAAIKKNLEKNDLKFVEITELDASQKTKLIKKYIELMHPHELKQLSFEVTNYLLDFDWLPALVDKIDFLELAKIPSWSDFVIENTVFSPNIFKFSISKPITPIQLKNIYTLFQNLDQNQLLLTMIYSQIKSNREMKEWVSKLIQTDYMSKTKLDALLWAKLWMYDILI